MCSVKQLYQNLFTFCILFFFMFVLYRLTYSENEFLRLVCTTLIP